MFVKYLGSTNLTKNHHEFSECQHFFQRLRVWEDSSGGLVLLGFTTMLLLPQPPQPPQPQRHGNAPFLPLPWWFANNRYLKMFAYLTLVAVHGASMAFNVLGTWGSRTNTLDMLESHTVFFGESCHLTTGWQFHWFFRRLNRSNLHQRCRCLNPLRFRCLNPCQIFTPVDAVVCRQFTPTVNQGVLYISCGCLGFLNHQR